jgi:hypothetical protein
MATKTIASVGEFRKDTAKGKKHFAVQNEKVSGAIYLTPAAHKALGEPDSLKVTVEAA